MEHFHPYSSLHIQALNACKHNEDKIRQMTDLLRQSKFKSHYKLLIYEMLEVLKENVEKAKRHMDDAFKSLENEVKQLPISEIA